jgi:hypothetical protein
MIVERNRTEVGRALLRMRASLPDAGAPLSMETRTEIGLEVR